ncbi:hypothetical protein ABBQ32_011609 [Trebouxia sp. C0010 RCD-2024]
MPVIIKGTRVLHVFGQDLAQLYKTSRFDFMDFLLDFSVKGTFTVHQGVVTAFIPATTTTAATSTVTPTTGPVTPTTPVPANANAASGTLPNTTATPPTRTLLDNGSSDTDSEYSRAQSMHNRRKKPIAEVIDVDDSGEAQPDTAPLRRLRRRKA